MRDLLRTVGAIGRELKENSEGLVKKLSPRLTMVGSVRENTRILLANELDVSLEFSGWRNEQIPFMVKEDDPFHLYR